MTAWAAGDWQNKAIDPTVKQLIDPDDGTTVIAELSLSSATPFVTATILI